MDTMKEALEAEGLEVAMVAINDADSTDHQDKLVDNCTFPLFQDSDAVDAWELHGASKDDMVVYTPDGTVAVFFDWGGGVESNLATEEGWANVEQALRDASGAP